MTDVSKFYHDVIEDVIGGVKDELMEDGVDMQVLEELKKLWTAKLEETHVFDPEPVQNSAAQYLNLLQRSQLGPAARILVSTQPSSHAHLAGESTARSLGMTTTTVARPTAVTVDHGLTRVHLQPQPLMTIQQTQRFPQQNIAPNNLVASASGVVSANSASGAHIQQLQAHRGVIATGIQQGAAPQLAALPSGLTGHLVQIGQQTYLVPQLLNVRQPGAPQLTISQLVGAAPGQTVVTCATTGTTAAGGGGGGVSDVSSGFQQTQVDGGHDSDDEKFGETPGSQQQTPSASVQVRSVLPQSVQPSDIDDDDDDDDDDDLVPATPGFTPSSVRSNHQYQLHRPGHGGVTPMTDQTHRDHLTGGTPMNMSGPPTPMTPPSVASRATAADGGTSSWRRPHPGQILPGSSAAGSAGRKRRHRSPYHVGDTDTEVDDEFDEDGEEVGDDVELMTNATMTPAGQAGDPEDEDDEKMDADRSQKNKRSGAVARAPPRPKASRTQRAVDADRSISSSVSHPDDIPDAGAPSRPSAGDAAPDSMLPPDESTGLDEEEEQEEEEEPLNSGDDVSDEEPEVLFESDNVVVCQYDKIHHSRNRWRLHLKDGIMAINGRDLVFQKAIGEAEW